MESQSLEALAILERGVTALSSILNVFYFALYRSRLKRRKIGAVVLVVVNLAFLIQSLYFGFLPYFARLNVAILAGDAGLGLLAGLLPMIASLLITLLIVRQLLSRRIGK